ncbi:SDR family oxidoreductase [Streptomyces sp. SS7]|uniref:SDR family oxidoreductase n=1 Tax=Streptomyces sp. SS7 TaxID=3108485 RepID=UPI0030EC769C
MRGGEQAAAEEACRTVGPAALPLVLDVTCAKSVVAAVREARGLTGGIDVLVNNAGVSPDGDLRRPHLDEDILRATLDTSLTGAWRVAQAVKTALNALTRMLAAELAGTGVLANAAGPGWTRSGMGGPPAPRGPEEGADTPVWPATLPDGDATTGGLFADRRPLPW